MDDDATDDSSDDIIAEFGSEEAFKDAVALEGLISNQDVIRDYELNPKDFYLSFSYLRTHPMFSPDHGVPEQFLRCLDIEVVKVNPETRSVDDIAAKNTSTEIWLEIGPVYPTNAEHMQFTHDIELDTGEATFEEAIVSLAGLVHERYGNDRARISIYYPDSL